MNDREYTTEHKGILRRVDSQIEAARLELDKARRAYLLTICSRGGDVARSYMDEKVRFAFQCTEPWQLAQSLDMPSQRKFQQLLEG